jgi:deoxyribose-phosphate aldolase
MDIARMIDQSLLQPDVVRQQVEQLCLQGREYNFITVVVNPVWVRLCKDLLGGAEVRVCTVSGFPLGAGKPEVRPKWPCGMGRTRSTW